MTALIRMRLTGFLRSGRALAPLIAALVLLSVLYGGGASSAASAYGYSAVTLFPVLAWLTKLVLDAEPDVQRQLARLTVGPVRESAAGLLAAFLFGGVVCVLAMLAPLPFGAVRGPLPGTAEMSLGTGVILGVLAHFLALLAAVSLGALAGRALTRRIMPGVTVLVTGSVLAIVLGLRGSLAPWLVPPVMAVARELSAEAAPPGSTLVLLTVWAVGWSAAVLGVYAVMRRGRA